MKKLNELYDKADKLGLKVTRIGDTIRLISSKDTYDMSVEYVDDTKSCYTTFSKIIRTTNNVVNNIVFKIPQEYTALLAELSEALKYDCTCCRNKEICLEIIEKFFPKCQNIDIVAWTDGSLSIKLSPEQEMLAEIKFIDNEYKLTRLSNGTPWIPNLENLLDFVHELNVIFLAK